ncbi:MAG: PilZ domain-containing protein [Rhodospirillaceae bacterium]|nr:PilZ domain-containing protein [Rhodospirillaceae bacterium]MDD9915246.1 PilZ domain-containing protein [Rhodospirillaceae bacterium]
MPNSEQRSYNRVDLQRKAVVSSQDRTLSAITEDISIGGLRARWSGPLQFNVSPLSNGEPVDVSIEQMTPVKGVVVRNLELGVAIEFAELNDTDRDRIAFEVMGDEISPDHG